ncbi:MAG: ATP-binding cassette domain-containing protein [Coriobacteriales bacterium]
MGTRQETGRSADQLQRALEELGRAITAEPAPLPRAEHAQRAAGRTAAASAGTGAGEAPLPGRAELAAAIGTRAAERPTTGRDDVIAWLDELLGEALQGSGTAYRLVRLEEGWQRDGAGALLGVLEDGTPAALIPGPFGYSYTDQRTGRRCRVSAERARQFGSAAFCFYRPLPKHPLSAGDLLAYMLRDIDSADAAVIALALCASVLLGLLVPQATAMLFGPVLNSNSTAILPYAAALLAGIAVAQALINGAKTLVLAGVGQKLALHLESAAMLRVLQLPAAFFRSASSGELASLLANLGTVATLMQTAVLGAALSAVFSLAYLVQIFFIAPALGVPALLVLAANCAVTALAALVQTRVNVQLLGQRARLSGWQNSLLEAVADLRSAGAEERAFASWAQRYAAVARLSYNGPLVARLAPCLQLAASLLGAIAIYCAAIGSGVGLSEYMAFSSAFGMVMGAQLQLAAAASSLSQIRPRLQLVAPLLRQQPEDAQPKPVLKEVDGAIELRDVSFSYSDGGRPVIDGVSLRIAPGESVAVVGSSGCGKSTLLRLLLGFEQPQRGSVLYSGRDLREIDVPRLRQHIGVVLQHTQLFKGDILSNIVVSAPWLGEEDAWRAAEAAGIADDIRALPMGMRTVIAEGGGGFSGGQRQRLAIARALAGSPQILMFDEATSALDNQAQQAVCSTLDALQCTRIVIAQRLSTIRNCDRILVLHEGKIAEEGSYESLMEERGLFYELVWRQEL